MNKEIVERYFLDRKYAFYLPIFILAVAGIVFLGIMLGFSAPTRKNISVFELKDMKTEQEKKKN